MMKKIGKCVIILLILTLSCTKVENQMSKDMLLGIWTIKFAFVNGIRIDDTLYTNRVIFDRNKSVMFSFNDSAMWKTYFENDKLTNLTFQFFNNDENDMRYFRFLYGDFDVNLYNKKSLFHLELKNDSVQILLSKNTNNIALMNNEVLQYSLDYDNYIPYPEGYNKYKVVDKYFLTWDNKRGIPIIDSSFLNLKRNYTDIEAYLYRWLYTDINTRSEFCNNSTNMKLEDIAAITIDILESYNIETLEKLEFDSCFYDKAKTDTVKSILLLENRFKLDDPENYFIN